MICIILVLRHRGYYSATTILPFFLSDVSISVSVSELASIEKNGIGPRYVAILIQNLYPDISAKSVSHDF
jgi:hypothetical protein